MAKACIAIGIGNTTGLAPLPGAVAGAHQLANWAKQCGYQTQLITDESGAIEISDVRNALLKLLPSPASGDYHGGQPNPPDRLIVYFAGHGMQSNATDMWLLSNSYHDQQAIGTGQLQEALERYGIPQIAIIADACRSPAVDTWNMGINPLGVLPLGPFDPIELGISIDTDLFQAVPKYQQAFMLRARADAPARCIFTSVMMEALHGVGDGIFNTKEEITSHTIVKYLRAHVNKRAEDYQVRMHPITRASWLDEQNVYTTAEELAQIGLPPLDPWPKKATSISQGVGMFDNIAETLGEAFGNGIGPAIRRTGRPARKDRAERKRFRDAIAAEKQELGAFAAKAKARRVELEFRMREPDRQSLQGVDGLNASISGAEVAQTLGDPSRGWMLTELSSGHFVGALAMSDFVTDLTIGSNGCVAMVLRESWIGGHFKTGSERLIKDMAEGTLDFEAALDEALDLRHGKHTDPVLGVIAAHLYYSVGDVRSIRRMASFYASRNQPVPYDIALLARVKSSREGGRLIAHIPGLPKQAPRTEKEEEFAAYFSASEAQEVPVAGRFPIMRNGWFALAQRSDEMVLAGLADLSSALERAPFTTLSSAAGRELLAILQGER